MSIFAVNLHLSFTIHIQWWLLTMSQTIPFSYVQTSVRNISIVRLYDSTKGPRHRKF